MVLPVGEGKNLSSDSTERVGRAPLENTRISKIVGFILASSAGAAAASAICFTAKVSCTIAFLVASVALVALGILVGVNNLANRFFSKSFATVVHAVHAVAMDVLALAAQTLLYPTFALFDKMITPANRDERPVLLVHGYLHNASAWIYAMFRLRSAGFRSIYTINLYHPFHSIDDYAAMVRARAEEIRRETGRDDLILVGHSMGGLVASRAAMDLGGSFATHVVTLGSPLKGTWKAYLGLGENARQMRPNSEYTQKLRDDLAGYESRHETLFYQIASTKDQLVPFESARLPLSDKREEMVVDDLGHSSLIYSPTVMDAVIEKIKPQRIEASSP